jgi:putative membrane protein
MKLRRPLAFLTACAALAAPALALGKPAAAPSADEFVRQSKATDAFEQQASQLVQTRGHGPEVRVFADMVVRDRAKAAAGFDAALNAGGKPQPDVPPTPEQARMLADLQAAPDGAFDKAYIRGQVKVNEQALATIRAYARDGDTPALKQAAAVAEPVIQHDLEMARTTEARMR